MIDRPDSRQAIVIPVPSLVVLVGAAGAGKSTFAARHFRPDEVLSSDAFRARLSGDAADQRRSRTVFALLHREAAKRLAAGRLVVIDATNVERHARRALVAQARGAGVPAVAIVLALPPGVVQERNTQRTERVVDAAVVERHLAALAVALGEVGIAADGFDLVYVLRSAADVDGTVVRRQAPKGSPRS